MGIFMGVMCGLAHDHALLSAVGAVNRELSEASIDLNSEKIWAMNEMMSNIEDRKISNFHNNASAWDKSRFNGVSAKPSGAWLAAVPSCALDQRLSNAEFKSRAARRLGMV